MKNRLFLFAFALVGLNLVSCLKVTASFDQWSVREVYKKELSLLQADQQRFAKLVKESLKDEEETKEKLKKYKRKYEKYEEKHEDSGEKKHAKKSAEYEEKYKKYKDRSARSKRIRPLIKACKVEAGKRGWNTTPADHFNHWIFVHKVKPWHTPHVRSMSENDNKERIAFHRLCLRLYGLGLVQAD